MAAEYPLVVVMEEARLLEGLMDIPTRGGSPLELQEDRMVVRPQGAPMVSHLQIPTVPSIPGLMDRGLLQVSKDCELQVSLSYPEPTLALPVDV